MKELIDIKFEILGYIKFLEFMELGEMDHKTIFKNDICITDIPTLSYEYIDSKRREKKLCERFSGETFHNIIMAYSDLDCLKGIKQELEELYSFLPKGKELNEYLYRLAVIKGF